MENGWVTPEGFEFGEGNKIGGFWIGKFEPTGTITGKCSDTNCNADLTILPNQISVRTQTISNCFYASRHMQKSGNPYGFVENGMDTHMTKNTEWGIVVMLSQSKYGKYGNSRYSGADKEVKVNNCIIYKTGIGADSQDQPSKDSENTTCITNTYETAMGQGASTTGNIYGVYDMSGGAWERVMGNYNNFVASSGFTNFPDSKYYNLYPDTADNFAYKKGDGTTETKGWYNDIGNYIHSTGSWFARGRAGLFSFNHTIGGAINADSFRLSLVLSK